MKTVTLQLSLQLKEADYPQGDSYFYYRIEKGDPDHKKPADPKDRNDLRCKECGAWGIERKEGKEWIFMI